LFEKQRHILLTSLLSVVIPLLIMGVLYGLMAIEARKQVLYTRIIPVNVNFVRPGNTRTEMNAGRVACYPSPVSHVEYAPRSVLKLERKQNRQKEQDEILR